MTPRPAETPHDRFEPALRLAREGHFAEAIAAARAQTGAAADDEAATAFGEVARIAQAAGDLEAVVGALEPALAARPGHADLHYRLARVLLRLKRNAEARAALDRALAINPRYVAARIERAQLDAREGFLGEALGTLRALSQEAPLGQSEEFRRGLERLDEGEWDEAHALFGRALESRTEGLRQRLERFDALMRGEDVARAALELHQAIAEYPAYPDLHARLGRAELRQGHWDDAAASFGKALEINPAFHDARLGLALALEATGMRAQAMDQVGLVLEREPDHAQARELERRWTALRARPAPAEGKSAKALDPGAARAESPGGRESAPRRAPGGV
jgi:tetratricopeptide (TPR) repeat protein